MANNTETPGVFALDIAPTDATFTNTGDMRLILTGESPEIVIGPPKPGVDSLALTGQQAFRGAGLQALGQSLALGVAISVTGDSLGLAGRIPQVFQEPPEVVAPEGDELSLTGHIPQLGVSEGLPVGTATLTGAAPAVQVDNSILILLEHFEVIDLEVRGGQPTASLSGTQARIGTLIENMSATEDDGRYNICDRTGFKALPGALVKDGYGNLVLPQYRDSRHPQEFIRSRAETHKGPKRPEPVGDELDVDDLYPDGVTIDDL